MRACGIEHRLLAVTAVRTMVGATPVLRGSVVCATSELLTADNTKYRRLANLSCVGRTGALFSGTVPSRLSCQRKCSNAPFCVSFVFFSAHETYGGNYCQTSATCLPSVASAPTKSQCSLYVKTTAEGTAAHRVRSIVTTPAARLPPTRF